MKLWMYAVYATALLLSVKTVRIHGRTPVEDDVKKLFAQDSPLPSSGPQVGPSVNIACVIEHCTPESASCGLDSVCRSAIKCAQKCMNGWDNDTTHEKFHVQNCTNKCAFTYKDKVYENFMSCLSNHKCISFPPIPNTCRGSIVAPLKNLTMKDIQGAWWVVKGFHPVYDCYPCQHLLFEPINATSWSYSPEYQVYLVNGSLSLASQHMIMPNSAPGKNISFVYHDVGLEHYETWWLIDKADDGSYALLYYCGNTLQWYYEGALVFARNRTLSEDAYKSIASAYQHAVALSTASFCDTSTLPSCPD